MNSILAIGAHPDDVEVGCFGTLLKHKAEGDRIHVVVTTKGGYGDRSWETIHSEMKRAEAFLDVEYEILDNPIGHYQMTWKTVGELDKILRGHKVDTVYSVWHGDSHQDHQVTFKNTLAACRTLSVRNLYCYELPDYSYRSQHVFQPRRFVNISDLFEAKAEAVRQYESYFDESDIDAIRGLASYRGGACDVKFAEAFEIVFEMWK